MINKKQSSSIIQISGQKLYFLLFFNIILQKLQYVKCIGGKLLIILLQFSYNLSLKTMDPNQTVLNIHDIVKAFETLANPINSKQMIKSADQYILKCESSPQFCLLLMSIFTQAQNAQTKRQILIHLKNVIKRNWNSKRKTGHACPITGHVKEQIKSQLLEIYKNNWVNFYKDFNQIFKYLSRQDFPHNYQSLNIFVNQVLTGLASYSMDQVLDSQQLLPYLSLVKVVYKQYAQRRMLHTAASFTQFCKPTIELSKTILLKISQALQIIRTDQNNRVSHTVAIKLLECSRKIDKIVLYCLQSMVSALQYDGEIIEVLKFQLEKVKYLGGMMKEDIRQQVELNILAIIESTAKLQSLFPLMFTQFLSQYLQLILQLLFTTSFQTQRLVNTLILANMTPLNAFPYYMSSQEFRESLAFRRDTNEAMDEKSQGLCHRVFWDTYSGGNVEAIIGKIVGGLMLKYHRENEDDEIIFEDSEQGGDGTNQQTTFELLTNFLKALIKRFKNVANGYVNQVINGLLTIPNQNPLPKNITSMYQLVLLLPKSLNQVEINLTSIFSLMEKTFTSQNYDMFCRLIRNFLERFDEQTVKKSFQILLSIITNPNISHHTVYQCSVCIRKILTDFEHIALPVQKVSQCIARIFSLIQIYLTNPAHLWNLLNLLIQILKALTPQAIIVNLPHINNCINVLVDRKNNDNTIICALAQLLQNLLTMIDVQDGNANGNGNGKNTGAQMGLCQIALKLVCNTDNKEEEEEITEMSKHWVWLCVMKNIKVETCPKVLQDKLLHMLDNFKEKLIEEDASLFFQILQQYMLSGILYLKSQNLMTFHRSMVQNIEPQNETRTILSFFSLCHTYLLLTDNFDLQLAFIAMQRLKQLYMKISPSINGLRSLLMMILSQFVMAMDGDQVFGYFGEIYGDYRVWFWPYVWGLEYISNKYASKLTTVAIMRGFNSIRDLLNVKIEQNLPLDKVLNFITLHTQPIKTQQALSSYLASTKQFSHQQQIKSKNKTYISAVRLPPRKIRLHVSESICMADLSSQYRAQMGLLFKKWDWGVDDLQERYTQGIVEKIVGLMKGNAGK